MKNNNSILFREYKAGDEAGIIELCKNVFNEDIHESYWKWLFISNPSGNSIIEIAESKERIVGHCAVIPTVVIVSGHRVAAAQSVWLAVHSDYRDLETFKTLCNRIYKRLEDMQITFIYAFLREKILHLQKRILGWVKGNHITTLERLPGIVPSEIDKTFDIVEITVFDKRFQGLLNTINSSGWTMVERSIEYLNWRYIENPAANYRIYCTLNNINLPVAYVVVKTHFKESKQGHIIDFVADTSIDPEVSHSLLSFALNTLTHEGVERITCWMRNDNRYFKYFYDLDFRPTGFKVWQAFKCILDSHSFHDSSKDLLKWFFCFGDWDVF